MAYNIRYYYPQHKFGINYNLLYNYSKFMLSNLEQKAKQIRRDILNASFEAKACHLGSALSCVEIMVDLFYNRLKEDDIFIFSKASGVATYYAILADKGYFSKEKLAEYLHNYPLPSKEVKGVLFSCGSLGHGVSVATGLALADRNRDVYVLVSDGEIQEGTMWESALFARQHKLNNLFVICDDNGIQAMDKTSLILDLKTAFSFLKKTFPNFKNVKTIKGFGVSWMEDLPEWHYRNLDEKLLKLALKEIK